MFNLNIQLKDQEVDGLKKAFEGFMDQDSKKIDFYELVYTLESKGLTNENPLMHAILKRVQMKLKAINDTQSHLIDFDLFLALIKEAMNERKTKKDVKIIFVIFDLEHSNLIIRQNIDEVALSTGKNLSKAEIGRILNNCSSNKKEITEEEFFQVMTRQAADGPIVHEKKA